MRYSQHVVRQSVAVLTTALLFNVFGCRDKVSPPPEGIPARKRLLVLTETTGYRHSSITTAVQTMRALGEETGQWYTVAQADNAAEVAAAITAERLQSVDAVVFANTTGTLSFTPAGRLAFYAWVKNGGAYIGIHSATDTFHGDSLYLDLVRGEFMQHGAPVTVNAIPQDTTHPACQSLPSAGWSVFEEIYEFKNWQRADVRTLLAMRSHPQTSTLGDYPLAWARRYGQGRMFYTALGHFEDTYANPQFRTHLTGGIRWALGLAEGNETNGNPPR
jgi:uncharacterized protein